MASALVSCIHSAVKDIERCPRLDGVVIGLMNLKSLLLCLEMLGSDVDDRSGLFSGIQDAIRRVNRKQLISYPFHSSFWKLEGGCSRIANEVQYMVDESKSISSPTPPNVDKVVGIVDTILDNALDFLHLTPYEGREYDSEDESKILEKEAGNALEVEIKFLKHFLVFATRIGVEQEQLRKVLIRIRPFAINAARIFICDIPDFTSTEWISAVHSRFPTAVAIDPGVYQAYAQALSSSTLSKYGHALHLDDFDASRKLNPLLRAVQGLSNSWKDQVKVLCRRGLRGSLKLQKMICDAAIELSSTQSENGPALLMDEDIFNVLGNFLNSLISMLWDVLRLSDSWKDWEKALYERLRMLRNLLKRPMNFDEEEIRHQTGGVICDAAIILFCSLHQTNVGNMSKLGIPDLLHRFDVIQAKANVDANTSQTLQVSRMDESTTTSINFSHGNVNLAASSRNQPLRNYPQVVGFQRDEIDSVLDRLTRGSKQLRIVPIIGMAGLGKTTFALELYNHPSVMYYFQARTWCTVSQVLDKRTVFLQLLDHTSELSSELSEHDLANELRKSLKGKRYLIFLDDVWTPEVWNTLAEAFPDDSTGSRVILTSRHHHIAPHGLIAGEPHLLRPREVMECLEILQAKLFPLKLYEYGMNFAEMCKGLPFTAVIVAGLLATTEQKGWKKILDSLSSDGLFKDEQCNSALELSFKHLSDDLKLCFLYFGAFPEDTQIAVKLLMRLWMAEGFVRKNDFKRIEDVARENMVKLIERSLVTVAKTRAIGGAKTCRLHDLIHEFCLTKAKQENFIHLLLQGLDQVSDFNEPCNLQRLSIHSDQVYFQRSRLFCPSARSLLFFTTAKFIDADSFLIHMSHIIQIYKHLQVLDLGSIIFAINFPNEIGFLTQLKYLSFQSYLSFIPSSIGNLSNLECFVASFPSGPISLPHTFWNLQNLKCFVIKGHRFGFTLPKKNLKNSPMLLELETLSGVFFDSDGSMLEKKQMRKFPNIRRLKCSLPGVESGMKYLNKIVVVPDYLTQLESLTIRGSGTLQCEFGLTENLRKLKLHGFQLSREDITIIGGFPNLEVLKLEGISFFEGVLEMGEGEFSKLRYLKLEGYESNLVRWVAFDEQLPCLQKLVLVRCKQLTEVPSCLDAIPTLEEIELVDCSPAVNDLVRGIVDAQEDWGNSVKTNIGLMKGSNGSNSEQSDDSDEWFRLNSMEFLKD